MPRCSVIYSADAPQVIQPGADAVFTTVVKSAENSLIRNRLGSGNFLLSGWVPCRCKKTADYVVDFGANIAINEGGTPGTISIVVALNGSPIPTSEMDSTPAAVSEYNHVSNVVEADVFAGCCETITIRNTSDQAILMKNAEIRIDRP